MAYSLSLDDVSSWDNQNQAAKNAIAPQQQNNPQPGFFAKNMQTAGTSLSPFDAGATKFGGNLLADLGSAFSSQRQQMINSGFPQSLLGNGGQALQNVGNNVSQNANQIWGVPQETGLNSVGQNVLEGIGQYAPYMIMPEAGGANTLSKVPYAGKILPEAYKGAQQLGAIGATQSDPGNALSGGITGTLDGAGLGGTLSALAAGIPVASKGISSGANWIKDSLSGKSVADAASNIYQDLSNSSTKDVLNDNNVNSIIGSFKSQKASLNQGYQNLGNAAVDRGYGSQPTQGPLGDLNTNNQAAYTKMNMASKVVMNQDNKLYDPTEDFINSVSSNPNISSSKPININSNTQDMLDNILNNTDKDNPVSDISQNLKSAIKQFNSNPSFDNAHNLQSMLGSEAADFTNGFSTNKADSNIGDYLTAARGGIKDGIHDTFNANGDSDLSETYKDLTKQWAANVVPYQNIPAIWNSIRGNKYPNILNTLGGNDALGNIQTIRDHLQAIPGVSDSITSQALAQSLGKLKDSQGNFNINPDKLTQSYYNLPENIKQFGSDDLAEKMGQLSQSSSNQIKNAEMIKKVAGYLGVGGLGMFLGDKLL